MQPLDSKVLVRHFTGSPAAQASLATKLLKGAAPDSYLLTHVHLSELVWVLETSTYKAPRTAIVGALEATLGLTAVHVNDESLLRTAIKLYGQHGMDWTDAYLVATALGMRAGSVVSFDRFDSKIKGLGVKRMEPA